LDDRLLVKLVQDRDGAGHGMVAAGKMAEKMTAKTRVIKIMTMMVIAMIMVMTMKGLGNVKTTNEWQDRNFGQQRSTYCT